MATGTLTIPSAATAALRNALLGGEQAEAIDEPGKEAVAFALLEGTKRLSEAEGRPIRRSRRRA